MTKREAETVSTLFAKLMESPLQLFPESGQRLIAPDLRGVYVIYGPRGKSFMSAAHPARSAE